MALNFGYRKYPNGYRGFSWEGVFRLPAADYPLGGDSNEFAFDSAGRVCSADDDRKTSPLAYFAVLQESGGVSSQRGKVGTSVQRIAFSVAG